MSFKVLGIYADGMVLQRNTTNCIFGKDESGSKIDLTFRETTASATVDADGNWKIGSAHYGAAILIPYGRVKGKIAFNSDTLEVKGYGYLEHTWQSGNPTGSAYKLSGR